MRTKQGDKYRRMNYTRSEAASTSQDVTIQFFLTRDHVLAITGPMPVFQDLAKEGKLEAHDIDVRMVQRQIQC